MPYVKSFNRLVWKKRDYSEVVPSIPKPKSRWNFAVLFREKSENAEMFTKKELESKLHEEWQKIDPTTCNNLVNYMQKRIKAVIKAKGGHTKYWLLLLMFTPLFSTFKYISLNHNFDFSLVLHNFSQGCIYIYIYIYVCVCVCVCCIVAHTTWLPVSWRNKAVVFLKHVGTERSRSVVRPTLDVTPTARDL